MNDLYEFGLRLQQMRKKRNLNQTELADLLGVTSQAVSKWENGLSLPDISLVPKITTVLGVDYNLLFGKIPMEIAPWPDNFVGLVLIHSLGDVACYSTKELLSCKNNLVEFNDGSTANLLTKTIVNLGPGEIKIVTRRENDKPSANYGNIKKSFKACDECKIKVGNYNLQIDPSDDDFIKVRIEGLASFVEDIRIEAENNVFSIEVPSQNTKNNDSNKNRIYLSLPEMTKIMNLVVNGCGDVSSKIQHFEIVKCSISGSGSLSLIDVDDFFCTVSGAGSMKLGSIKKFTTSVSGAGSFAAKAAEDANITISGAGSLAIGEVNGLFLNVSGAGSIGIKNIHGDDSSISLSGNSQVTIDKGFCEKMKIEMSGNSTVIASEVTVGEATIRIDGDGRVDIGRVIHKSIEQIMDRGTINIQKRGE